ncbi:MAG: putative baseplate assembly protein [Anaerolineaceae bacterium 4572_5.2]|nr:MAG: putative baseplate assembly protein [Anaerolineaceae bacterium 4572_5.2]
MPLPEPNLDDLRFQQDLVDEARLRIIRYCPEWTDYNVSDPGITLIELFAWMTEQIVYRLNRVPDKNYIKFLDMLGVKLQPASPARAELTFRLSAPLPLGPENDTVAVVSKGIEVATLPSDDVPEIIFTTDEKLTISPPILTDLRREVEFHKNYIPRLGIETFYAFKRPPQEGDTFYLGFDPDTDLRGHILRLTFWCDSTQATGVKREDPPLVWECSIGDGEWQAVQPSLRRNEKDTTGGLNNPQGALTLYLPLDAKAGVVRGRNAFWLRCRFEQRRPEQGLYSQSPRITNVAVHAIGAATTATHAVYQYEELLGESNGDPGQIFQLDNAPILILDEGEGVMVEEIVDGELVFVPWEYAPDFSTSTRFDRHFSVDEASGEVSFGPSVRQPDGSVRQYGRVPEVGRKIMFSQYRYGGGVAGNVPVGKIQILRSAVPYIDQVSNLKPAAGGRDQENMDEAKFRARRELRAQKRAVTAEDFEYLTLAATREVARVKCNAPGKDNRALPSGMIEILLVPAAVESLRMGDRSALRVDQTLIDTVKTYLDRYRLLTTTLRIREPNYIGVKVIAQIVPHEFHNPDVVEDRVLETLDYFIAPLSMTLRGEEPDDLSTITSASLSTRLKAGILDSEWEGWPFGRDLYQAEVYSLIQRVKGVKHVLDVQLKVRPVIPSEEILTPIIEEPEPESEPEDEAESPRAQDDEAGEETEDFDFEEEYGLTLIEDRAIEVFPDTLLCSLEHEVIIVEL